MFSPNPTNLLPIATALTILIIPAQSACSREILQSALDKFYGSALDSSSAALEFAPNARITENNFLKDSLSDSVHSLITSLPSPNRIDLLDEHACTAASNTIATLAQQNPASDPGYGAPADTDCTLSGVPSSTRSGTVYGDSNPPLPNVTAEEGGPQPWPNMLSVRIAVTNDTGAVTELEIMNIGTGKGGRYGGMLRTDVWPEDGPLWHVPVVSGEKEAPSRAEMMELLGTYTDGIRIKNGANVPATKECWRLENGLATDFHCTESWNILPTNRDVTNERWWMDTKTGIALGKFFFARMDSPLYIHDYFKVTDGLITEIYAAMIPWGCTEFVDKLYA